MIEQETKISTELRLRYVSALKIGSSSFHPITVAYISLIESLGKTNCYGKDDVSKGKRATSFGLMILEKLA
jgi:hypothetical protein